LSPLNISARSTTRWACCFLGVLLGHGERGPSNRYRLRISSPRARPCDRSPHPRTKSATRIADANFMNCSHRSFSIRPSSGRRLEYLAAVVTVVSARKPEVEVEGDEGRPPPVLTIFSRRRANGFAGSFFGHGPIALRPTWCGLRTLRPTWPIRHLRREEGAQPVKLNPEPVKTPAYRDTSVQPGKKYFYSVSAIDERNNRSAPSAGGQRAGTVSRPPPAINVHADLAQTTQQSVLAEKR